MTQDELYRRANEEMTRCYESGIRCMESAKPEISVRFFRDYTEGEIDAIALFSQTMYLTLLYDYDNEKEEEEQKGYNNFCRKIEERSKELKHLTIQYAVRFL